LSLAQTPPQLAFPRELLNNKPRVSVYDWTMTKLIALVAAGMFAAGTMFAGEHGDCAKQAGNDGKMACTVAMADLNLTPEQKTKMDTLMAEHHKEGCTKETEKKFMHEAKGILSPEQFAKFKAECKGEKEKPAA